MMKCKISYRGLVFLLVVIPVITGCTGRYEEKQILSLPCGIEIAQEAYDVDWNESWGFHVSGGEPKRLLSFHGKPLAYSPSGKEYLCARWPKGNTSRNTLPLVATIPDGWHNLSKLDKPEDSFGVARLSPQVFTRQEFSEFNQCYSSSRDDIYEATTKRQPGGVVFSPVVLAASYLSSDVSAAFMEFCPDRREDSKNRPPWWVRKNFVAVISQLIAEDTRNLEVADQLYKDDLRQEADLLLSYGLLAKDLTETCLTERSDLFPNITATLGEIAVLLQRGEIQTELICKGDKGICDCVRTAVKPLKMQRYLDPEKGRLIRITGEPMRWDEKEYKVLFPFVHAMGCYNTKNSLPHPDGIEDSNLWSYVCSEPYNDGWILPNEPDTTLYDGKRAIWIKKGGRKSHKTQPYLPTGVPMMCKYSKEDLFYRYSATGGTKSQKIYPLHVCGQYEIDSGVMRERLGSISEDEIQIGSDQGKWIKFDKLWGMFVFNGKYSLSALKVVLLLELDKKLSLVLIDLADSSQSRILDVTLPYEFDVDVDVDAKATLRLQWWQVTKDIALPVVNIVGEATSKPVLLAYLASKQGRGDGGALSNKMRRELFP